MTNLSYPFTMQPLSEDEGGGYLVEFPDLPGCMSDGETPEEAVRNGADAVQCWIAAMRDAGRPIPPPSKSVVAGRTVSIDRSLYHLMTEVAAREGLGVETIVNLALLDRVTIQRTSPLGEITEDDRTPAMKR